MKKELSILGLALAPTLGFAAATALPSNQTVETKDCTLLQDNLKVTLSNGVAGAYDCNTTVGAVLIGACHTGGRVTGRSAVANTPAGCGGTTTISCTGTTNTTISGATVPTASTNGGSINNKFPGANCDSAGSAATTALGM